MAIPAVSRRPSRPAPPGTVRHDGRPMRYAHGSPAAYTVDLCRCPTCSHVGTWVAPDATRRRLIELHANGVRLDWIARAMRVTRATLDRCMAGQAPRVRQSQHDAVEVIHQAWAARTCTASTSPQPSAAHAWAEARAVGWQVPPASWPPLCPTCRPDPVGALFHT